FEALIITSIGVPSAVANGSWAHLTCNYDLQGDQLLSVKWYRDYVEFYRYQPPITLTTTTVATTLTTTAGGATFTPSPTSDAIAEARHAFDLDGIHLNLSQCNATSVHLSMVSVASEGTYKCEVSVDGPSFATVSEERQLKVYVLPRSPARLSINNAQRTVYDMGDTINMTCTLGAARPASQLAWYINDMPAPIEFVQNLVRASNHNNNNNIQDGQDRLALVFQMRQAFARLQQQQQQHSADSLSSLNSSLKLKCVASITLKYVFESNVALAAGRASSKPVRRPMPGALRGPLSAIPLLPEPQPQASRDTGDRHTDYKHHHRHHIVTSASQASRHRQSSELQQSEYNSNNNNNNSNLTEQSARLIRLIDLLLASVTPNEAGLYAPTIELVDTSRRAYASTASSSSSPFVVSSSGTGLTGDYQPGDTMTFECSLPSSHAVPSSSSSTMPGPDIQLVWLINGRELKSRHINRHQDGHFFYVDDDSLSSTFSADTQPPSSGMNGADSNADILIERRWVRQANSDHLDLTHSNNNNNNNNDRWTTAEPLTLHQQQQRHSVSSTRPHQQRLASYRRLSSFTTTSTEAPPTIVSTTQFSHSGHVRAQRLDDLGALNDDVVRDNDKRQIPHTAERESVKSIQLRLDMHDSLFQLKELDIRCKCVVLVPIVEYVARVTVSTLPNMRGPPARPAAASSQAQQPPVLMSHSAGASGRSRVSNTADNALQSASSSSSSGLFFQNYNTTHKTRSHLNHHNANQLRHHSSSTANSQLLFLPANDCSTLLHAISLLLVPFLSITVHLLIVSLITHPTTTADDYR
ncbi:hypothetical protein GZH46_02366, partial [Fragariocoptes setiger]